MGHWMFIVSIASLLINFAYGQVQPEVAQKTTILRATERQIKINGKEATIFALLQPDGTLGLTANKGQPFDVILENSLKVPTSIHWHGLILPNDQDGVAFITQFPVYPKQSYHYKFPLVQAGTFWMHSHFGLQEQQLLSAPLILLEPDDRTLSQRDVVVFLADFSFKSPLSIYEQLRSQCKKGSGMNMKAMPDIVEVDYDAFLANYRTSEDPEIVSVQPGEKVRLRIINGSSATNFFLSPGALEGEAIAVDGNRIKPLRASRFELAVAQRIDILITIPQKGGAFPVLAKGEGTNKQAGLILAIPDEKIPPLSSTTVDKAGRMTNAQEVLFQALSPLPIRPVDKRVTLELGGDMANYLWTLNGQSWPEVTPIVVEKGQRVEIIFKNVSSMAHPMHLHGHVFQVTEIDGQAISGAMRDTVLVLPRSTVAIQFDADNPGVWPLHCHVLYHLEGGMLTVVRYKDYIQPLIPLTSVAN